MMTKREYSFIMKGLTVNVIVILDADNVGNYSMNVSFSADPPLRINS